MCFCHSSGIYVFYSKACHKNPIAEGSIGHAAALVPLVNLRIKTYAIKLTAKKYVEELHLLVT